MSAAHPTLSLDSWFPPAPAGSTPPRPLRAIGIVGAGKSTTGIAHRCASKGLGVMLHSFVPGALSESVEIIRGLFREAEIRQEISAAAAHKAMGGISITTSMDDVEFCDIVIETLVEGATEKHVSFSEFARKLPPDLVLASCAAEPGLEEFGAATPKPDRVIGLQFSDPVGASTPVQVTIGRHTSRETAERVVAFIVTLGLTPVLQGKARSGA